MKALTLSGGGSRGAYQVGALVRLAEEDKEDTDPRMYSGVSVGSINATFLSQYKSFKKGVADLHKLWNSFSDKDVYKHNLPFLYAHGIYKTGLLNTSPLEKTLKNNIDQSKILESGNILRIGAVDLQSYKYKLFTETDSDLVSAIMASAAFPIMFPAIKKDGKLYTDGGVRNVTPLMSAISIPKITTIDVIVTEPNTKINNDKPKNVFDMFPLVIGAMMDEIVVNDVKMALMYNELIKAGLRPNKRIVDINLFRPEAKHPGESLKFGQKEIQQMIAMGYKTTDKQLKQV